MKLVVQVKLLPSADQAGALQTTLHAANDAANRVSQVAYDKKVFRNFARGRVGGRVLRSAVRAARLRRSPWTLPGLN